MKALSEHGTIADVCNLIIITLRLLVLNLGIMRKLEMSLTARIAVSQLEQAFVLVSYY